MKKDFLFKVMACLLPLVLLLLLEAALRLAGFGDNLSLFTEDPKYPEFLHLNNKVSLRYFLLEKNATSGNKELFHKTKRNGVTRIFVQGESTSVGFPYFHNGAFPRMLSYRLQHTFPETQWEIINLSMTALNSYALYDFADEIIAQQPDAVIINAGHNEFYGALGVGSTGKIGNSVIAGRWGIALRKTKTGRLLSKFMSAFSPDADKTDYNQTLMKRMVKSQEIAFGSKTYQAGITQFEKNLKGTLDKYHKAGVKVYLTNAVSNRKDLPPFISVLSTANPQPEQWRTTFDTALNRWKQQQDTAMLQTIYQLHSVDSCFAQSWYVLGEIAYAQKDYAVAYRAYLKAKELDALRFRAPEAINGIIRELSLQYDNVVFVDVEKSFEAHSPGGIIGENLILEHLHPNLLGHFIIADALYRSIERDNFQGITGNDGLTPEDVTLPLTETDNAFEEAWAALPLTEADSLTGVFSNWLLREGWPFNEPLPADDGHEKSLEEAIAGGLAVRTIKWEAAMLQLMEHYISARQLDKAVKIGESFLLEYPYEQAFYNQTVNLCIDAKQYSKGIFYAQKSYALTKTPETARQLVILYMKQDEPANALPYIDILISSGGNVDYRPMKDIAQKIIAAQKQLLQDNNNQALKNEIYQYYMTIQNVEAANKYN